MAEGGEGVADVERVIVDILREHCHVEGPIDPDSDLTADLALDSLGILTLLAELETHFRLIIEDVPDDPPSTVRQVAERIAAELASRESHEPSLAARDGDPP